MPQRSSRAPARKTPVIRALEIVGEATNKARVEPRPCKARAGNSPGRHVRRTRNRIVHDYFEVDLDVVWQTIQRDLPVLRPQIVKLLARVS
ncbi:MAG: DUF86 domain-containing protein [Proteobacteria bacterium]|nr:DUF86 domain-containing protein [Pseudomonadota bacterium]